jgi:tRNA splicing endonuclease
MRDERRSENQIRRYRLFSDLRETGRNRLSP